jgi:hypothetical protein
VFADLLEHASALQKCFGRGRTESGQLPLCTG